MDRVVEQTVTWTYKGQTKEHTARYFVGASDTYNKRAEAVAATALTAGEVDAIEEYNRACQEGKAVIVAGPKRRKVE